MKSQNEPLNLLLFLYRSTIPKNHYFYILFFIMKFIGLFLVTHNTSQYPDVTISIEKCLKMFIVFQSLSFSFNYVIVSIVLCIIIFILIIGTILLYIAIKRVIETNIREFRSRITKVQLPKNIKLYGKILTYLFLIIILFSEHIIEVLMFCTHVIVHHKFELSGNSVVTKEASDFIKEFMISLNNNHYVLCGINLFFALCVEVLAFLFIEFSCHRYMTLQVGSAEFTRGLGTIFLLITFLFQGLYTTCLFIDVFRSYYGIILNDIAIAVVFLYLIIDYKKSAIILTMNPLLRSIYFIIVMCIISGVYEIFLFYFEKEQLTQLSYFIKIIIELSLSTIVSFLIFKTKRKGALKTMSSALFNKNKPKGYINALFQFSLLLNAIISNDNHDFLDIYSILQRHMILCTHKERCPCQKINLVKIINSFMNDNQKNKEPFCFANHTKIIIENYIMICEEEIKSYIYTLHKSKRDAKILQQMIILHCDFLLSIKNSPNQAIYTIQQYMNQSKHKFSFTNYYYLYELNRIVIKSILQMTKVEAHKIRSKENDKVLNQQTKIKDVMEYLNGINQVKQYINHFCCVLSHLLNTQNQYTPFDAYINNLQMIEHDNTNLQQLISMSYAISGALKHKESCYLLSKFFFLIYKEIPEEMKGKFLIFQTLKELENTIIMEKKNPGDAMIISITPEESFVINYVSQHICDELQYNKEDLINQDFHILIPEAIRKNHERIMQMFINYNNRTIFKYKKKTYFIDINGNLIEVIVDTKRMPTYSRNITLIIQANFKAKSQQNKFTYYYHFLLNAEYNILAFSPNVEKQFMFNLKMFEDLRMDFCFFFNIPHERLVPKAIKKKMSELSKIDLDKERDVVTIFTSPSLETIDLYKKSRNVIEMINKDYCFNFTNAIKKQNIIKDITRFTQRINDYGLDNQFQKYITYLTERLHVKPDPLGKSFKEEVILGVYDAKYFGEVQFYVAILKEEIDPSILYINNIKDTTVFIKYSSNMIHTSVISKQSKKLMGYNIFDPQVSNESLFSPRQRKLVESDERQRKRTPSNKHLQVIGSNLNQTNSTINSVTRSINNETIKSTASRNVLLSQSENIKRLNASNTNNSSNTMNVLTKSGNLKKIPLQITKKIVTKEKGGDIKEIPVNPTKLLMKKFKYDNHISYAIWMLFSLINIFIITKSIISSICLISHNKLMNIINSAILLQGELLYASLEEIDHCLVKDGLVDPSISDTYSFLSEEGLGLIESIDVLTREIYSMAHYKKAYDLFTKENEYDVISFDWKKSKRKSTLTEEIHLLHYYIVLLRKESTQDIPCRFSKYFIADSLKSIEEATIEEQLIYYLIYNTQFQLRSQIAEIKVILLDILSEEAKFKKTLTISFHGLSFLTCMLFFIVIIIKLSIYNNQIKSLLNQMTRIDGKELLEKLKIYKSLLINFDAKKCAILDKTYTNRFPAIIVESREYTPNDNSNSNSNSNNTITKKPHLNNSSPYITKIGLGIMIVWIIGIISIILTRIFTARSDFDCIKIYSGINRLFLERIPVLYEFLLYAKTSVFMNNANFIKFDNERAKTYFNHTYFIDSLRNSTNSLYEDYPLSQFSFLYYQLDIISQSLTKYVSEKYDSVILRKTKIEEKKMFQDFCFTISLSYIEKNTINAESNIDVVNHLNEIVRECRVLKYNDDSLTLSLELMILQITTAYADFWKSDKKDKMKTFLESILMTKKNIRRMMKLVEGNIYISVDRDVNNFVTSMREEEIIWVCVMIAFCFLFILVMIIKVFGKLYHAKNVLLTQGNFILTALKN